MSTSSTPTRIQGWTSTPDEGEVEMPPFSPFQSWDTAALTASLPQAPLATLTMPPPPPPAPVPYPRPSFHRHSLSLNLPSSSSSHSSHYRSSSYSSPTDRRAQRKREDDPSWVPRPPNAFIVFRCEYSRLHAQEHREGDASPVAEKTLSKRAGEAWKKLSAAEQEPFKVRAELAREEHAKKYPNYRYKPRRRQGSVHKSAPVGMSRREQVESFLERVKAGESTVPDSGSERSASTSASSSPEPPELNHRATTPVQTIRRQRSYSLPQSRVSQEIPQLRTYLLEPSTCGGNGISEKRAQSECSRPQSFYTPTIYTPPNELSQYHPSYLDESFVPFSIFDSDSTAPSTPDSSIFDSMSFDDSFLSNSSLSSPQSTSLTPPSSGAPNCPSEQELEANGNVTSSPPANALFHRRQRSNTTSAIPPSPLSVLTSSLSNWNGEIGRCSSMSSLPTFTFPSAASPPSLSVGCLYGVPGVLGTPDSNAQGVQSEILPAAAGTLLVPSAGPEMDLDRTPRCSDFPKDVQTSYTHPSFSNMGELQYPPEYGDEDFSSADLESYAVGLDDLSIFPSTYNPSPFNDLDFSELFRVSPEP